MSEFKFTCPHCDQSLEGTEDMLGQALECPSCSGSIRLPEPEAKKEQSVPLKTDPVSLQSSGPDLQTPAQQKQRAGIAVPRQVLPWG